jgi:anti-sigma factor RsiW
MHSNSTTPHATHDELLLARLYGGDVNELERARALDLVAACEECAGFFADLGAIATATAAMAVPPRPRDFTLSEADAARLRRRSNGGSLLGWFGWTRALGGSMAAIGLVGVVALGALAAFGTGPATSPQSDYGALTAAGQPTPQVLPSYPSGSLAVAPEVNGGGTKQDGGTAAISLPGSPVPPSISTAALPGSQAAASAAGGLTSKSIGGGSGSGGPDSRTVALAGSVGLLALGLLLLAAPRLAARRARR